MTNQLPDHLRRSGWLAPSVASSLTSAGVPIPTADYLTSAFDASAWETAAAATQELTALFSDARFADTATFGPLLVPNPQLFDVRRPCPATFAATNLKSRNQNSVTNASELHAITAPTVRHGACLSPSPPKPGWRWEAMMP